MIYLILLLILLGCGSPGTGHAPHVTSTEIGQRANEDLEELILYAKKLANEKALELEREMAINAYWESKQRR